MFTSFGLLACSSEPDSPEGQVRALLDRAEVAAEKKDLGALKPLISDHYTDGLGQNKRGILGILAYHFLRNKSIHLLTRVQSVTLPEPDQAEATVFVAMAGRPIPAVEELAGLRADLYRFDFALAQEGENNWKVIRAVWRPAEIGDFL
ncbi:MAG: hypothetical protein ACE5JD_11125 [Candidatus Methylomirabilia bacterium]